MTNFSSLKIQAELALAKLTEGKHYVLSDVSNRLQKTAATYPQDIVITTMASVVEQLCHKYPNQLISQGDIEKLYNEFIGLNASGTRFREVLGDLLLSEQPSSAVSGSGYIEGIRDPISNPIEYDIDKEVKSGFDQIFTSPTDKYDPRCVGGAKEKVELELKSIGFNTARVKIAGGNSKFLVFTAELDTNRGAVRVYIPADASGQQFPSSFIAGNKFEELNSSNLNSYIAAQYNNYNENKNTGMVELPKVSVPASLKSLASDIEESVIESAVGFPQATVRLTKRMLLAELNSMGFKGAQIRVSAPTNDGFICEATINSRSGKTTIEIPIEMRNNAPLMPSVFAKGDYVADFTVANLRAFAMSEVAVDDALVSRQDTNLDNMELSNTNISLTEFSYNKLCARMI